MNNIFPENEVPYYVRDFLNYLLTVRGKSNATVKEYFYDLRLFLRYITLYDMNSEASSDSNDSKNLKNSGSAVDFNSIRIRDFSLERIARITLSDLYSYMSFLIQERNVSSAGRARKTACLKTFYKYMFSHAKLIDKNPAAELESPKIPKRLPKYLELDESLKLLNTVSDAASANSHYDFVDRDYAILTLFLNCGMRLSELVGINISSIRNDTLKVIGKGNKERTIYLNNACISAVQKYLAVRPHDAVKDRDALFLSERRQRISNKTVQYIVKKYITAAGLDPHKYSVHKLRHTAATLMYRYGEVDIRALQQILGHESISTTEIYTHVNDERLKEAADKNPLSNVVK